MSPSLLTSTARDLGAAGYDVRFGHGRVNASAAVSAAARTPRSLADAVAPAVGSVTALPAKSRTSTTYRTAWKVRSTSGFTRVGTTGYQGSHSYNKVTLRGTTRIIDTYRFSKGIVYRRRVVQRKVRTPIRRTRVMVPVRVEASDDSRSTALR